VLVIIGTISATALHVPFWQVLPDAQSLSLLHDVEVVVKAALHVPFWQVCPDAQSLSLLHDVEVVIVDEVPAPKAPLSF